MDKQEFLEGWRKLRVFYPRLADIESEIDHGNSDTLDAWMEVVGRFSKNTWIEGVKKYCARERYAPVPAQIREYCFAASRELKAAEAARVASIGDGTECKWCGGSGWIFQEGDGCWPTVFNCVCSASRDPETGRRVLDDALADEKWEFVPSCHAFHPKRKWVTEVDVSKVRAAFENNTVGALF